MAGILYAAAIGSINPNFGFTILLSLFAAAVLGGIGNAYGALAGGIVIGLAQEWSTLFFNPRWKPAVGFAILILTLLSDAARHLRASEAPAMSVDFWLGVGVIAGIYGIFALGLQINAGFTGLLESCGQAGFMSIGAYAMGMLVTDAGWSLWRPCPPPSRSRFWPGCWWGCHAPAALRLFRHRHHRLRGDRPLHVSERRFRRR